MRELSAGHVRPPECRSGGQQGIALSFLDSV